MTKRAAKALSERERRFVEAYMGEAAGNATKAAEIAGFSSKSAAQIGHRLLRKVKIQAEIDARVESDPAIANREARQRFWTAVMIGSGEFAKCGMSDRLKASELLGKSQADFVERHEHNGKLELSVQVTLAES